MHGCAHRWGFLCVAFLSGCDAPPGDVEEPIWTQPEDHHEPTDEAAFGERPEPLRAERNHTTISGGHGFTCAVRKGRVWCWGEGDRGELGRGEGTSSQVPIVVPGLTDIVSVAALTWSVIALQSDGTVWRWGTDPMDPSADPLPKPIPVPSDIVAIAGGSYHACALRENGLVLCWGYNGASALGVPESELSHSPVPIEVPGVEAAVAIAAGDHNSCAVIADGTVKCWGRNPASVFVGDGEPFEFESAVEIPKVSDAVSVAVNQYSGCAVIADGTVRCWGDRIAGGLGDGTNGWGGRSSGDGVVGIHDARQVDVAFDGTGCAVLGDGTVRCWGAGEVFQHTTDLSGVAPCLDALPRVLCALVPVELPYLDDVVGFTNQSTYCAQRSDGSVLCWGYNGRGNAGIGSDMPRSLSRPKLLEFIE